MPEYLPDALEVVRRVDADRVVACFDRLDADAVLERAQLFERLGLARARSAPARPAAAGTRGGRRRARRARHAARRRGCRAHVRDRRAREIQRVAVAIDDDLRRRSGSCSSAGSSMRRRSVLISSAASARTARPPRRSSPARCSGSSPCTLTTTSQSSVRGDFGEAIGAALVRRRGHPHASPPNARTASTMRSIVGGDDHARDRARSRRRGGRRARSSAGRRCRRAPCRGAGSTDIARG